MQTLETCYHGIGKEYEKHLAYAMKSASRFEIVPKEDLQTPAEFRLPILEPYRGRGIWVSSTKLKELDAPRFQQPEPVVQIREDVPVQFRDIVSAHEHLEAKGLSHREIFAYEIELSQRKGICFDYLSWLNRQFREMKRYHRAQPTI